MPPRALTNDEARRKAALTALTSHPSWPELAAEIEQKVKKIEKLVLHDALVAKGGRPISERDLIYLRGFVWGMRYITTVPRTAEATLERFLREQGIRIDEEAAA
jgi:hypothetical protein